MSFITPWNEHLYPPNGFSACNILHKLDWTVSFYSNCLEYSTINLLVWSKFGKRDTKQDLALFKGNSPTATVLTSAATDYVSVTSNSGSPCASFPRLDYSFTTPFSSDWNRSSSSQPRQALAVEDTQSTVATPQIPTAGSGAPCGLSGSSQTCMAEVVMPQGTLALPGERRTGVLILQLNWNLSRYWTALTES